MPGERTQAHRNLRSDTRLFCEALFFFSSRSRHTRLPGDWSSDVCSSDLPLARWCLGAGIVATTGANLAHGLGHGPIGALVSAWPAVALAGSFELLMTLIRTGRLEGGERIPTSPVDPADQIAGH